MDTDYEEELIEGSEHRLRRNEYRVLLAIALALMAIGIAFMSLMVYQGAAGGQ